MPDTKRQAKWRAWCSEAFADFCGCLAVGPAFVANLADFLARCVATDDSGYPPPALRFHLNLAFLANGFDDQITELKSRWDAVLPLTSENEAFARADAGKVGAAWRDLDLGLKPFSLADQQAAEKLARDALQHNQINDLHVLRRLVAAIRIAYDIIVFNGEAADFQMYRPRIDDLVEVMRKSSKPDIRAEGSRDVVSEAVRLAARKERSDVWMKRIRVSGKEWDADQL